MYEFLKSDAQRGYSAIGHALIKGCPHLKRVDLHFEDTYDDSIDKEMLEGMLEAAGRDRDVEITN